jgi:hypothetical protein
MDMFDKPSIMYEGRQDAYNSYHALIIKDSRALSGNTVYYLYIAVREDCEKGHDYFYENGCAYCEHYNKCVDQAIGATIALVNTDFETLEEAIGYKDEFFRFIRVGQESGNIK